LKLRSYVRIAVAQFTARRFATLRADRVNGLLDDIRAVRLNVTEALRFNADK
jgi:hypothetical protein